jgi:hypothetical protein
LAAPILNILVPQLEQVPVVAGFPFFIVIAVASFISFLALHFTQYASMLYHPFLSKMYLHSIREPAIDSCFLTLNLHLFFS